MMYRSMAFKESQILAERLPDDVNMLIHCLRVMELQQYLSEISIGDRRYVIVRLRLTLLLPSSFLEFSLSANKRSPSCSA